MRDPARIDRILIKWERIWKQYPDLRFCQLLENMLGCHRDGCFYYVEDDQVEECLDDILEADEVAFE